MKYPACNVSQTHQVLLNLLGRMFLHYSRAQNRKQEDYFNKSFNLNPNWIQDFLILFGWLVGWLFIFSGANEDDWLLQVFWVVWIGSFLSPLFVYIRLLQGKHLVHSYFSLFYERVPHHILHVDIATILVHWFSIYLYSSILTFSHFMPWSNCQTLLFTWTCSP